VGKRSPDLVDARSSSAEAHMMHRLWFVLGIVIIASISLKTLTSLPRSELQVIVCDVGQGDGILIVYGFYQLLVDAGRTPQPILTCLEKHMPAGDSRIESVVMTHPDSDHFGGLSAVIDRYAISQLLLLPIPKETADYKLLMESISGHLGNNLTEVVVAAPGMSRVMGSSVGWQVLSAGTSKTRQILDSLPLKIIAEQQLWDVYQQFSQQIEGGEIDTNGESIVLFLTFNEFSLLLTGDIGEKGEQALISQGVLQRSTVLKVGHHGSKSSSSTDFLKIVQPELALISAGQDNSYGHPHKQVLSSLEASHSTVLRTDLMGEIVLTSDGFRYWWHTQK